MKSKKSLKKQYLQIGQKLQRGTFDGFSLVKDTKLLLKKHIVEIQGVLEKNDAGVRKQAGTNLKNALTGEVIYTPPQDYETIQELLTNLFIKRIQNI